MNSTIRDGATGTTAEVTEQKRLKTLSSVFSALDLNAIEDAQSYTVHGTVTVNNAAFVIIHLKNTSTTRTMLVSQVRVQLYDQAGGTALPNTATSFDFGTGQTYSSGGTAVTPANTNAGSANTAEVTAYHNGPTIGGTHTTLQTIRPIAEAHLYTFDDLVVVPLNRTFSVRCTTDHTSGVALASVKFSMVNLDTVGA